MGSMIKGHTFPEEKRQIFMRAFGRLSQRVLWKWENDTMPGKPDNVMIQKWMPQFDVLCKLMALLDFQLDWNLICWTQISEINRGFQISALPLSFPFAVSDSRVISNRLIFVFIIYKNRSTRNLCHISCNCMLGLRWYLPYKLNYFRRN